MISADNVVRDNIPSNEDANMQLPTFPYKVWDTQTNDAPSCIAQCALYGFNAAGLEYASQCCMFSVRKFQSVANIDQSVETSKTSWLLPRQRLRQIQMMCKSTLGVQFPPHTMTLNAMPPARETLPTIVDLATDSHTTLSQPIQ